MIQATKVDEGRRGARKKGRGEWREMERNVLTPTLLKPPLYLSRQLLAASNFLFAEP